MTTYASGKAIFTRRRDQLGYSGGPCGDQIIGGIIFCDSQAGRVAWIKRLSQKHPLRFNYFVRFADVQSRFALQFGHAAWVLPNCIHVL